MFGYMLCARRGGGYSNFETIVRKLPNGGPTRRSTEQNTHLFREEQPLDVCAAWKFWSEKKLLKILYINAFPSSCPKDKKKLTKKFACCCLPLYNDNTSLLFSAQVQWYNGGSCYSRLCSLFRRWVAMCTWPNWGSDGLGSRMLMPKLGDNKAGVVQEAKYPHDDEEHLL